MMVCWYWILQIAARFLFGDHEQALEAVERARRLIWSSDGSIQTLDYHFYSALTLVWFAPSVPPEQQEEWRARIADHQKQLRQWSTTCPENFESAATLVDAEVARIEDRALDAMDLYERAIRAARAQGFVQTEGLADELAARFYEAPGFTTIAQTYLRHARHCYIRWGAEGKVQQLEQLHPYLREEPTALRIATTIETPLEQLDLATVVKTSLTVSGEIVLDRLIETLMVIAVEHAGAERGVLVCPQGDEQRIEAEAITVRDTTTVHLLRTPATSSKLPTTVLQHVIRTQESIILDDATAQNPFSTDEYIRQKHVRSFLCIPLVNQTKLIGVLCLENNLAPSVFTPARIAVLKVLSSQAAISLENARLYADLISENQDRQKAEAALRQSEASLTEAQQISNTGSWRWNIGSNEITCSEVLLRIFGFASSTTHPSRAEFMKRIHVEDRSSFERAFERSVRGKCRFEHEYRIILPDGSVKYLQSVAQPAVTKSDGLEFVGTIMDITERRRAEEALRSTQAELTRVARLTTLGELVASISHEINQPLTGIMTSGGACLRWLDRDEPNLDEAQKLVSGIVRDAHRAREVIRGLRALAKKSEPQFTAIDINDVVQEVLMLTRSELQGHGVTLHTALPNAGRPIVADRVQLQQVLLNLITNGIRSMNSVADRPKVLTITSEPVQPSGVLVAVEDSGTGLDPAMADRIFDPFFTTKPEGMGIGLSICRSIIEAHGGRLWASPREPCGTVFRFIVPGVMSA